MMNSITFLGPIRDFCRLSQETMSDPYLFLTASGGLSWVFPKAVFRSTNVLA